MLAGKKIILAVCGSIAAYKTAFFVRLLKKQDAEVKVIMTSSAKEFISPLTLATLSKNAVESEYFDTKSGVWTNHVELGLWADLMVIAPLSANTLGKMANGICDNLLLATYLSAKCPVMVAPAMDLDMYLHPTTKENLNKLSSFGNLLIEARDGELASGLTGKGRMAEPEELLEIVQEHFAIGDVLKGKKVLITSGPTFEAIDPVRFIGNHSSGKMGKAIAEAFQRHGAETTMITGPASTLPTNISKVIHLQTAKQMLSEAQKLHEQADIVVFAAAVADYRPDEIADKKIKKQEENLTLRLVKNPDIAFELGKEKKHQTHIGFALETDQAEKNALEKLQRKNFDMIILNSLEDSGSGFKGDTNKVTIFDANNNQEKKELKSKTEVAQDIISYLSQHFL